MLAHIAADHPRLRGNGTLGLLGRELGPRGQLPRHAARRRRHRAAGRWSWSPRSGRRGARLRYESWHLLHLYAYLGVGLALPHQLWTGADFLASPLAPLYWWALYARRARRACWSGGSGSRWPAPCGTGLGSCARWSARRPGVVSVHLRGRDLHRLPVPAPASSSPGASSTARAGPAATPTRCLRPPTGDALRITVKDLGDGSAAARRAAARHPGAGRGPVRPAHGGVRTRRRVTLLACGIGITPLRALLEDLPYGPGERDPDLPRPRHQATSSSGARSTPSPPAAGPGCSTCSAARIRDRSSWLPEYAAHLSDARGAARAGPRHRPPRRVPLRGRPVDGRRAGGGARAPASRPRNIHVERFSW